MNPAEAGAAEPPYNPATESTNEEQVSASTWELLRRNDPFQAVAKKWISSQKFRASHTLTQDYRHLVRFAPRCALDWMLTAEQRLDLAHFQIEKQTWELHLALNFGPVNSSWHKSPAGIRRKDTYALVHVVPMSNAPGPISCGQAWHAVPEPFKAQFRLAVNPRKPGFACVNTTLEDASVMLGTIARKLAVGDPLNQQQNMACHLFDLGAKLHLLSRNHRLYALAHGDYSRKAFDRFLASIKADFTGLHGMIFDGRKYDRHKSYLGTVEDWHWFLEAEWHALDIKEPADLYRLAELYSEDLRHRAIHGKAPARTKAHGHTGTPFTSKIKRNRRSVVKRHVLAIQNWIDHAYSPLPLSPSAAVS